MGILSGLTIGSPELLSRIFVKKVSDTVAIANQTVAGTDLRVQVDKYAGSGLRFYLVSINNTVGTFPVYVTTKTLSVAATPQPENTVHAALAFSYDAVSDSTTVELVITNISGASQTITYKVYQVAGLT